MRTRFRRTHQNVHTICYKRSMRLHSYGPRPAHLKWLLDSDPAIRWQVMKDLTDDSPHAIAAERARVATEGWGGQLLALQSPAGNWGEFAHLLLRPDLPKEDQALLITLYTLVVLMDPSRRRQQAGSQNDRPRRQAARVYAAEQPPFPSRRNGALHQRQNPRHWRVFQRTKRRTGESAPE